MENKYYTPSIEEFHMGFEYEYSNDNIIRGVLRDKGLSTDGKTEATWIKDTLTEITAKDFKKQLFGLKVKYLDKEDIESLGWKEREDLIGIYKIDRWELCDLSSSAIMISRFTELDWPMAKENEGKLFRDTHFKGLCKNKSELKVLMKQLNIV